MLVLRFMITRRNLLSLPAALPTIAAAPAAYLLGVVERPPVQAAPPSGMRLPFGWPAVPVETELTLKFRRGGQWLRLTNVLDSREIRRVEARTALGGVPLGVFDMRFAYSLQVFEIGIDSRLAGQAVRGGVTLRRVEGQEPMWILTGGAPAALRPHLLQSGSLSPMEEFHRRLRGLEAVQPFGWMDGCVLDALADLKAVRALEDHLRLFLPGDGHLVYEDPRSRPADDRACSIEDTLPFAQIARLHPRHPSIEAAISYWKSHLDSEGCVVDGNMTSTEGAYTVGYPMAVIARLRRDRALEELALRQIVVRRQRLSALDTIHLRFVPGRGHSFRGWARGVAWYMMGLARTLEVLAGRPDLEDSRRELLRTAQWVLRLQDSAGLWNCFLDDPSSGVETSGSAGIAAALARGVAGGLLPASMRPPAERALGALRGHLTPDGYLNGVAQSNRGGEALQRSGYRVLSQMGMGLMGQLVAALDG